MDLYGFIWIYMGFHGPAWSTKRSSDSLASGNRASTGGRAPHFDSLCSNLSCARHFVVV